MHRKIAFAAAILSLCCTGMTEAQTPDPKADLALIQARAQADAALRPYWNQLRDALGSGTQTSVTRMLERVGGRPFGQDSKLPLNYRLQEQIQAAGLRAQAAAEILRSDLDGDWQITREELIISLGTSDRSSGEAAAAFILGDEDGNNLLDITELRKATERRLAATDRNVMRNPVPRLFDFDDDGILTQAEFDRGVAALTR